jgi:hypothetical protein
MGGEKEKSILFTICALNARLLATRAMRPAVLN